MIKKFRRQREMPTIEARKGTLSEDGRKRLTHTGTKRVLCMVERAIEISSIYGKKERSVGGPRRITYWARNRFGHFHSGALTTEM